MPPPLLRRLTQGMGMLLIDCTLRDDVAPYQRYDLEGLLPGAARHGISYDWVTIYGDEG